MVASFYLDGPILSWFQWMFINGFITSWSALLQAIESRFAPSIYDDPREALFKLTQRGTVTKYLTEFEKLANCITGLSPSVLLSCFISGLSPEIRREVQAFQPLSLPKVIALAHLQEDKINDRRKHARTPCNHPSPNTTSSNSHSTQTPRPKPPFVQRTQEDMAYRREKGLCYNCDEKWSSSHRCKGRFLFFIANSDESSPSELSLTEPLSPFGSEPDPSVDEPTQPFDPASLQPHISLHAMAGMPATDTFRLYGLINNICVTILVDSGSTHNFVQPRVAKFLNLPMQDTIPLRVMVGNGSVLDCQLMIPETKILIQDHSFVVTLRVLPLSGADVILGVEWLRTLGPVVTYYTTFTMKFTLFGKPIHLRADVQVDTNLVSAHQVKRLISTNSTSGLFHLSLQPIPSPELLNTALHPVPAIDELLLKYESLFNQPTSLLPLRQHDHQINLIPSANPIS